MWTVIYVSQSIETAKKLIDVLVPSTELETAQDLIFENELF